MNTTKKFNYLHIIASAITIFFIALTFFVFPTAITRIIESFKDFGTSVAYYFKEIFFLDINVTPSVINKSSVDYVVPFGLPQTWEEFQTLWKAFWKLFISKQNFLDYMSAISNFIYYASRWLLLLGVPIILLLVMLFRRYISTHNNKYNKDSLPLKLHRNLTGKVYLPIVNWLATFKAFLKANSVYIKLWIFIWCFNFNLITILIEFLAFYFLFVATFYTKGIYTQVYKLFCDLSVVLNFIPLWAWLLIAYYIICVIRKKIGYATLNHYEAKNCGFINERPIVLMVCGTMGKKKTTLITDMALSQEVMLRDKAFEKILENDLKFPNFPWINLENDLKKQMSKHKIYNLATTKQYIYSKFLKWNKRKTTKNIYDYDFNKYGLFYDDKLKIDFIWQVIETYAQLYFIYIIQCSLIISNYSIRTDNLLEDLGNFPMWNTDFFQKDSRLIDSYSRHSHIVDFDALRLGRKVIENNPQKDSFEFGVINLTEVGKERKNNLELRETKRKEETTNQKNDGFNDWLKMVRHSATVDMFPFVKVITDEQRPESWGADARDLCEIVHIKNADSFKLCMPLFTITELLYQFIFSKFEKVYHQYRFNRADNTLFMHLVKSITAKFNHYVIGIHNTFGVCTASLQVESGTQDGELADKKYYLMSKKIYSKRFSTDCFSDFFNQKSIKSKVGICDLKEYDTEKASFEELQLQNSYFMNDLINKRNDID